MDILKQELKFLLFCFYFAAAIPVAAIWGYSGLFMLHLGGLCDV